MMRQKLTEAIKNDEFTVLEKLVIEVTNELADEYHVTVTFKDIVERTGLLESTIKGVIGSLVKKEILFVNEDQLEEYGLVCYFPSNEHFNMEF